MSNEPLAIVHNIDGEIVLEDPAALAMIRAVGKSNCAISFRLSSSRFAYFKSRFIARNLKPEDAIIVIVHVDDINGGPLADALMPGFDWQAIRDKGEKPFARGLAVRNGIQKILEIFDKEAADKLRDMKTGIPVVVVDYGVAEVYEI